jgi:hypothetical protein
MPLRSDLLKIASDLPQGNPTRRSLLAALHEGGADLWLDRKKDPEGRPYPKSLWDKFPERFRPFTWATPAFDPFLKKYPMPWRVAHKDEALAWAQKLEKDGQALYADTGDLYRKKQTIIISFRDNRNADEHHDRTLCLGEDMLSAGFPVILPKRPGSGCYLRLVDDLERNVLR